MAKKTTTKTKPETLPAVQEAGGAVVSYDAILAERAAKAKARVAQLPAGGAQGLSFKGGTMAWAGQNIGHETHVIVLDYVAERTYYDRPYNENDKSPPTCYSYDGEGPHDKAAEAQSSACENCQHNQWGSANVGDGKACKEGARIIVVPADTEDFAAATPTTARVSTLNTKFLVDYVNALDARKTSLPRVVTKLTCHPDSKSQYKLGFVAVEPFRPAKGQEGAFLALLDKADAELTKPYPEPREDAPRGRRGAPAPQKGAVRRSRM